MIYDKYFGISCILYIFIKKSRTEFRLGFASVYGSTLQLIFFDA